MTIIGKTKAPTTKSVKTFNLEIKSLDAQGYFEGYANTFGLVDAYNEVVVKGAFARTISHWRASGKKIPMLSQHDHKTIIGYYDPMKMEEDEKGLKVAGQLLLEIQDAKDDYVRAKEGLLSMSIGFDTLDEELDRKTGIRYLKEIRLWEVSLVTWAANVDSVITSIKALDFSAALTQADTEQDLWERRWELNDALWASMRSIAQDDELDDAGKVAMFDQSLTQYHQAMLGWFRDAVAAKLMAGKSADDLVQMLERKDALVTVSHRVGEVEQTITMKAGAVLSKANKAKITDAIGLLQEVVKAAETEEAEEEGSGKSHPSEDTQTKTAPTPGADDADVARLVEEIKAAAEEETMNGSLRELLADMKKA